MATFVPSEVPGAGIAEDQLKLGKEQFAYLKAQDELRRKNIAEAMKIIEGIFGKREPLYGQLKQESLDLNMAELARQAEDAQRTGRFALARAGTSRGSAQSDLEGVLAEQRALGAAQSEIYAQSQADTLRAQDEGLRSSLAGLAASGTLNSGQFKGLAQPALKGLQGVASYADSLRSGQLFQGFGQNIGAARGRANTIGQNFQQPAQQQQPRNSMWGY